MTNPKQEKEQAWIGDAVLELFVRNWILSEDGEMNGEKKTRFTSNQFLACFGNPTSVEARIGKVYESEGLDSAFAYIEREFLPLFLKQEAKSNRRQA